MDGHVERVATRSLGELGHVVRPTAPALPVLGGEFGFDPASLPVRCHFTHVLMDLYARAGRSGNLTAQLPLWDIIAHGTPEKLLLCDFKTCEAASAIYVLLRYG